MKATFEPSCLDSSKKFRAEFDFEEKREHFFSFFEQTSTLRFVILIAQFLKQFVKTHV